MKAMVQWAPHARQAPTTSQAWKQVQQHQRQQRARLCCSVAAVLQLTALEPGTRVRSGQTHIALPLKAAHIANPQLRVSDSTATAIAFAGVLSTAASGRALLQGAHVIGSTAAAR
jgi:hypothetical protein